MPTHGQSYSPAYKKYRTQKQHARRRGIDFLFTFEEWVHWWEVKLGSKWLENRGRKSNQYCMARKGDVGPYSIENTLCITSHQNGVDRSKNGTAPCGAKMIANNTLTAKNVLEIFRSKLSVEDLAQKYKVSASTIKNVKRKKTWKHLTQGLR